MNTCNHSHNDYPNCVPTKLCGKESVLCVNDDYACEEHAPELAQLSDIKWPMKKEQQQTQPKERL